MKNKKKIVIRTIIGIFIVGLVATGFVIQSKKLSKVKSENLKLQNSYNDLNKQYKENDTSYKSLINADNQQIAKLTAENKALKNKISELKNYKKNHNSVNTKVEKVLSLNNYNNVNIPHAYFDPNNLLAYSNTNYTSMEKALAGTALEREADIFVDAEKEYGLNALFLAGLVAQESGWGTSNRSINDNNMTGYTVYSPASEGTSFSSKRENIMTTARLLRYKYLREGGQYYNGLDIWSVNKNYCATGGYYWANSITSISRSLVEKINS